MVRIHGTPSVLYTFLCHFQSRALFVPDSQWNVYRMARYRATEWRPSLLSVAEISLF